MTFGHATAIWSDYPQLVPGVVAIDGITAAVDVRRQVAEYDAVARSRLETRSEGELPEIQAWRRVYARMGLKPTQYRCASEALLRRFRKEGRLPQIHPLIDLCNAISLAFAIPVAVFDSSKIGNDLEVRYAAGDETYETFSGELERPEPGEVIFVDNEGRAHARRWTNRQSGHSAVSASTSSALIVAEAMHDTAQADINGLVTTIARDVDRGWPADPTCAILTSSSPRFEFRSG